MYLVVLFDRYDTHKSLHWTGEAASDEEAIVRASAHHNASWMRLRHLDEIENIQRIDDTFSCIALEESDILVYKLGEAS